MGAEKKGVDMQTIMTAQWAKERTEGRVSWKSFVEASSVFTNDYAIVNHAGDPVVSMMGAPRTGDHAYSVSGPVDMDEGSFKEAVDGKECVIFIACMDARAVVETYKQLQAKYPGKVVIFLSMGGGVVQQDTVIQGGQEVRVDRAQALATQLSYLGKNARISEVIATAHDARCGAVAFFNDGKGVPELLQVEKGSSEEQADMWGRIESSIASIVPEELQSITTPKLVHIDEAHHHVDILDKE